MGDLLQFLLIAGVIGIAIIRQVSKNKVEKTDTTSRTPFPEGQEQESTETTLPGNWEQWFPTEMKNEQPHAKAVIIKAKTDLPQKKEKKLKESAYSPLDRKNNPTPNSSPPEADKQDFGIHSTEDARRAIIWSEILERKY